MNDSMKTKMEELITKFSTDKIKVSENLSIEHRDKYDARIYEEGFVDCYDLMSSEVEELQKNWDDELEASNKRAMQNIELRDQLKIAREALEEVRELTFGPHEKPHATIFNIIKVIKKSIGLNDLPAKLSNTEGD